MHTCPCCGHKTLPGRATYDLCPVCWWEDEGSEPWEYSGPNGQTLVEAQQEFLARRRPYPMRPGKVRPPKRRERRDPEWRPFDLTDELVGRVRHSHQEWQRFWEEGQRRGGELVADDPEGPFKEYNAAVRVLRSEAAQLPDHEVTARLQTLNEAHGLVFSTGQLELLSRRLRDESFYRRHPVQAAWWLISYARPRTFRRRWSELRTGRITFAG